MVMVAKTTWKLTYSARKENRMLDYNKRRINIGHQHDHWLELKDILRVLRSRVINK